MLNERQIKNKIYRLKEEIRVLVEILEGKSDAEVFGRPLGSYEYSDDEIVFLRENKEVPMKELIIKFNEKFKTDLPKDTRILYNFMYRIGIITPKFRREYFPRKPTGIHKGMKTKEKERLKKMGINT